jgi:hypothetical protein
MIWLLLIIQVMLTAAIVVAARMAMNKLKELDQRFKLTHEALKIQTGLSEDLMRRHDNNCDALDKIGERHNDLADAYLGLEDSLNKVGQTVNAMRTILINELDRQDKKDDEGEEWKKGLEE